MGSGEEGDRKAYGEFMEKVKRTVFIDYLSPVVTVPVLKTAIGQFGNVLGVHLVPNWLEQREVPQCALVEMENETQARCVVAEMSALPFMISGMPRPIRAQAAREEMFCERARNPDRSSIRACWVDPSDTEQFEAGQRLKQLVRKHARESAALLQVVVPPPSPPLPLPLPLPHHHGCFSSSSRSVLGTHLRDELSLNSPCRLRSISWRRRRSWQSSSRRCCSRTTRSTRS